MNVYKITVDMWVVGDDEANAIDNLIGELDYLMGFDAVDLKVVSYEHPQHAVLDEEVTEQYKEETE
jgi:hypothetical protein